MTGADAATLEAKFGSRGETLGDLNYRIANFGFVRAMRRGINPMRRTGMSTASERILAMFAFLKDVSTLDDIATKSITFNYAQDAHVPGGYLTPVSALHAGDQALVGTLAQWRDAHQYAYPSRFKVTEESTARWINDAVVYDSHRLLFLVLDQVLRPIGHIGLRLGLDDQVEVDNVLRGESGYPGIMAASLKALESWAAEELDAQHLKLYVIASNVHAVTFYTKAGYAVTGKQPMQWEDQGEIRRLVKSLNSGDEVLLTMTKDLQADQLAPKTISTAGPLIGVREATYCLDATRNGWNTNHSHYLRRFEDEFAEYIGVEYALATSSCTGALHLAMLAAGIGPGDEVIVPETTWVATAAAVAYTGARPVFADVEKRTWTMDPEIVKRLITPRTKAIVPVHLYGYAADMETLMGVARETDLRVIEDAAPAIGALVAEQPVGSIGDVGCFSFQGAKMLVTGEGGMLVTNDRDLFQRAQKLQDHGRVPGTFWIDLLGRKYKMSNLSAALGLAQLESSEMQICKKRRINEWYRELLAPVTEVTFQEELSGSKSVCWMTSITISPESGLTAKSVASRLSEQGIDTRPVFPPISSYPIWGNDEPRAAAGPNAASIAGASLNLPSGVRLSRASIERVSTAIAEAVAS